MLIYTIVVHSISYHVMTYYRPTIYFFPPFKFCPQKMIIFHNQLYRNTIYLLENSRCILLDYFLYTIENKIIMCPLNNPKRIPPHHSHIPICTYTCTLPIPLSYTHTYTSYRYTQIDESCNANTNNRNKLYHYRICVTPDMNFAVCTSYQVPIVPGTFSTYFIT